MTEDELIEKLKNGDNHGYTLLVEEYSKKLYYFCLKILKNSFDAQDAVQITFIKINTSIGAFEKRGGFSSWIYKIALNSCNDILRARKRSAFVSFDEVITTQKTDFEDNEPEKQLLFTELGEVLYEETKKLPKLQKSLVVLRDVHGFSYREIGRILNLKEGTVKSGLNRARKKLKKNLEEYFN